MEYFCEKTVEVFDNEVVIHQRGEVARTERKSTLDDMFRRYGTKEMQAEWFENKILG